MHVHMVGERRRTIALASLTTLLLYLVASAIVHWASTSDIGKGIAHFFALPAVVQGGSVAVVWLGWWLLWMGQREMIAYNEGVYGALLAITQVRGLRGLGLSFGVLVVAIVAITYAFGMLTPQLGIVSSLAALTFFALGLPNAPTQAYHPTAGTELVPVQATVTNRIVDANW